MRIFEKYFFFLNKMDFLMELEKMWVALIVIDHLEDYLSEKLRLFNVYKTSLRRHRRCIDVL